jgi:gas vesicle protein
MARHQEDSGGGIFAAFVLGALAGAAVALLYAPTAGDETRRRMTERAREGREKAMRAAERGRAAFEQARREQAGGGEQA